MDRCEDVKIDIASNFLGAPKRLINVNTDNIVNPPIVQKCIFFNLNIHIRHDDFYYYITTLNYVDQK